MQVSRNRGHNAIFRSGSAPSQSFFHWPAPDTHIQTGQARYNDTPVVLLYYATKQVRPKRAGVRPVGKHTPSDGPQPISTVAHTTQAVQSIPGASRYQGTQQPPGTKGTRQWQGTTQVQIPQ